MNDGIEQLEVVLNHSAHEIPRNIGPYAIQGIIGRGGMGVVYRGIHGESGHTAAIKTVYVSQERQLQSILREIRALARIRHPGIIRIIEEGIEDQNPWFAMEMLTGTSLADFITSDLWANRNVDPNWTQPSFPSDGSKSITTSDFRRWEKILGPTLDADDLNAQFQNDHKPPEIPRPILGNKPKVAAGRLPEVLNIALGLCHALAYLHGEGIVHRDLKPSNIVLRDDHSPILMDFGLMQEFWRKSGRDTIEDAGAGGGTLLYLPPEQIRGDPTDARADLYSLGCILYLLTTGQLPFLASSVFEVSRAHQSAVSVRPSDLVDDIPAALDDLILRLLSKKPNRRIGHAGGVAKILSDLGAIDPHVSEYPKPKSYLYRPSYSGRQLLIDEIVQDVSRLREGQGGMVLIGGESGMGKTRFLLEFNRLAPRLRAQCYYGECAPMELDRSTAFSHPLHAFQKMMQEICDCFPSWQEAEQVELFFTTRGAILLPFFPGISQLPCMQHLTPAAEIPQDAARIRLFSTIAQLLEMLARHRPLLILLDDLQWADDLTSGCLEFLLRGGFLARNAIFFLGTYRPEELSSSLRRLLSSPSVVSRKMERLSRQAIFAIVSDMMAHPNPSDLFIGFLESYSDGNPFFVSEFLRSCVEENLIFRDDDGRWQVLQPSDTSATFEEFKQLPAPRTLRNLIEHKLNGLNPDARQLICIAAVIGREIDTSILWSFVSFSGETLDMLDVLIHSQLIEENVPGTIRFVHDIVHQVAYEQIDPSLKQALHCKVAEAIEQIYGADSTRHLGSLAQHWERAGRIDRALVNYRMAAREALKRYANSEAEHLMRSYIRLAPTDSIDRITARNTLARQILAFQGRMKEAEAEHLGALKEAEAMGSDAGISDSLSGITYHLALKGDHPAARIRCLEAITICNRTKDRLSEAHHVSILASIEAREGNLAAARTCYQTAFEIYESLGESDSIANTYARLGILLLKERRLDEAEEHLKRALEIHSRGGNRHCEADDLKNIGIIHWARNSFSLAQMFCEKSLTVAREIGDRREEASVLSNLAVVLDSMNDLRGAVALYDQIIRMHRELGDRLFEALTMNNCGFALYDLGRIVEAEDMFRNALAILEEMVIVPHIPRPLRGLALIERQVRNDLHAAEKWLDRVAVLEPSRVDPIMLLAIDIERAHIAMARNQSVKAAYERIAQDAHDRHLENDPSLREELKDLRKAVELFERGGALFRGSDPDTITAELLKQIKPE